MIVWETEGKFSLPKVQNLHIDYMRTSDRTHTIRPLNELDIFDAHESIESVHSCHIACFVITSTTIDTLQLLKGLRNYSKVYATLQLKRVFSRGMRSPSYTVYLYLTTGDPYFQISGPFALMISNLRTMKERVLLRWMSTNFLQASTPWSRSSTRLIALTK